MFSDLFQDSREDDKHSTPIQSVDSALESWDSSRSGMESGSNGTNAPGNQPTGSHSNQPVANSKNNKVVAQNNQEKPNQTVNGQVTVHRPQSQQSDHRTVPTREVIVAEEPRPPKPPVAPKPAFCNSQNCRLSHANRNLPVNPEYPSRSSKSNPNLLSASSDYPDSYYRSMGHAHSLNYHHGTDVDTTNEPPTTHKDDLHIVESSEAINIKIVQDRPRRDSHYHSNPDLQGGSPDHVTKKQACDRLLSPIVSVSKASTPDPTIAKGRAFDH